MEAGAFFKLIFSPLEFSFYFSPYPREAIDWIFKLFFCNLFNISI
uniref:Uncharacterized protein n=1 Tax=Anguilla anguilla TaxID=7936 RepID=A0A0E9QR68_ANGAN